MLNAVQNRLGWVQGHPPVYTGQSVTRLGADLHPNPILHCVQHDRFLYAGP